MVGRGTVRGIDLIHFKNVGIGKVLIQKADPLKKFRHRRGSASERCSFKKIRRSALGRQESGRQGVGRGSGGTFCFPVAFSSVAPGAAVLIRRPPSSVGRAGAALIRTAATPKERGTGKGTGKHGEERLLTSISAARFGPLLQVTCVGCVQGLRASSPP